MTTTGLPEAFVSIPTNEAAIAAQGGDAGVFGFVPAMPRLLRAHPGIAPAFAQLGQAVMRSPGVLDARERQLVAAVTSAAQDCHY